MRVSVRTHLINMPNRTEKQRKSTDFTPTVTDTNGKAYSKKPLRKPLISVKLGLTARPMDFSVTAGIYQFWRTWAANSGKSVWTKTGLQSLSARLWKKQ